MTSQKRRSRKKIYEIVDEWKEPEVVSLSDKYHNPHPYPNCDNQKLVRALLNQNVVFSGSEKAWEACRKELEYDTHSKVDNPAYTQAIELYRAKEAELYLLWDKEGLKDMFDDYGVVVSLKVMQSVGELAGELANGSGFREIMNYLHDLIPLVELVLKEHCQNTPLASPNAPQDNPLPPTEPHAPA
jgi:hypothetical protein